MTFNTTNKRNTETAEMKGQYRAMRQEPSQFPVRTQTSEGEHGFLFLILAL